jgi:hypothetical protein
MLTIEYKEGGIAVADKHAEQSARRVWKSYEDSKAAMRVDIDHLVYSTINIVTAFRMLVAEGLIPHNDIEFKYKDELLKLDKLGQFIGGYPIGFWDTERDFLKRMHEARKDKSRI